MDKEELVHLTLKQLNESLSVTPENFRFEDPRLTVSSSFNCPTIIWQHRMKLDNDTYVQDPLNNVRTIIVCYNSVLRQVQCYIYHREVNHLNVAMMADAQAHVTYNRWVHPTFYRTYRQFTALTKRLTNARQEKEFLDYMKRLSGIFPGTHEDELFK